METRTIEILPPELIVVISKYLNGSDLDACFNVCQSWRHYLNTNKIWRRCCIYPEKYFQNDFFQCDGENTKSCVWRRIYERQQTVWSNWTEGKFVKEKTNIRASEIMHSRLYVDRHGHHWLFKSNQSGIDVKKMTKTSISNHCRVNQSDQISILPITDKMLAFRSNYIKVFQFKYPEYDMKLQYRFKFNMDSILPTNEVVPDDEYMCYTRYILLLDRFFVGYIDIFTDINTAFFHVWDLGLAEKITTQSVFQQSFLDFLQYNIGSDITHKFEGGLILFAARDSTRFLVNIIADRLSLCQISLFSLDEMRFMNVVAQLESRTAWCFMEDEVVVIYHPLNEGNTSQISVYNASGQFLAKLDFPALYNPAFMNEFWFGKAGIILKAKCEIHIIKVTDSKNVYRNNFKTDERKHILTCFDPKFLVMFDKYLRKVDNQSNAVSYFTCLSIWDTDSGVELWKLTDMISIDVNSIFNSYIYPGKLFVQFHGEEQLTVLNFEHNRNEQMEIKV